MRCHPVLKEVVLPSLCVALFAGVAATCGGTNSSVASAATADAAIGLQLSETAVTLDNRTGTSLVKGQLSLMPAGVRQPFFIVLPRIQSGEKRSFPLDQFRGSDGTPFTRSGARAKSINVTATDLNGKAHQYEIPFD
jgi:hypothetical protein